MNGWETFRTAERFTINVTGGYINEHQRTNPQRRLQHRDWGIAQCLPLRGEGPCGQSHYGHLNHTRYFAPPRGTWAYKTSININKHHIYIRIYIPSLAPKSTMPVSACRILVSELQCGPQVVVFPANTSARVNTRRVAIYI